VVEGGEEELELLVAGCEEGPTTKEEVFVIATGSPSENAADDVGKLLVST